MYIAKIRVASKVQMYKFGTKDIPLIAAKLEIVGTLFQGHRECMKARLKHHNNEKIRPWLIAFHNGTVWIGHPRTSADKKVTIAYLEDVGNLLGLCLSSSHAAVSVSPDPDLELPPNILFQDPDPDNTTSTKITALPDRSCAYRYRGARETRNRSHP